MTQTRRALRSLSIRAKLVILLLFVEAAALAFLVWQGHEMDLAHSERELHDSVARLQPLLNVALAPATALGDGARVSEILSVARTARGLRYLVVKDPDGRIVAADGLDPRSPLPALNLDVGSSLREGRLDNIFPLTHEGRVVGNVRSGIAVDPLREAIGERLADNVFKAAGAFLMSVLLFLVVVHPLTRRITQLRLASERIAGGDYAIRVAQEDTDEIGRLARALNHMAGVIQSRMDELESSRQRFHNIADYTYDVECWFGPDGRLLWINKSVERLTGHTVEECLADREFPFSLIHPDDRFAARERSIAELSSRSTGSNFEFRVLKKDGTTEWVTNSWQPIFGRADEFLGLRSSLNSIQALKDTEIDLRSTLSRLEDAGELQARTSQSLRAEHSRLVSLLSAMNFGVVFVDPASRVIYSNPAFSDVWSIPRAEALLGRTLFEALGLAEDVVSDLGTFAAKLPELLASQHVSASHELALASGRILRLQVCPVQDETGAGLGSVLIHEDITLARESESQLAFLAERDPLTGLYNRRRFERELAEKMDHAAREKQRLALLFFDLDEFKSVNDLFGHRMGDTVLLQVAGEIRSHLRKNEFFARIGGDEFALLVADITDEHLRSLADRLMRAIGAMNFNLGEVRLSITSSLGIALYPSHATTPQELIAHADAAMYQAKDGGKNTWRIYRPDHTATLRQRSLVTWNDRIRNALKSDAFELHLQGVFETAGGERRYHEALLRMPDVATGKLLQPGTFIGFAEKSNLIIDIDRWVVTRVIDLLAASPSLGPIAVNISGRSFDEPEMPDFIARKLRERGVDPSQLYVEITETAAIRDMRDAQRFILALHDTGCKVCLDDFGAGFSTFAYIKQLPVDVIKIDGLFVRNLARERDNQVFVRAMLDIARGFGKEVVAEAVEDVQTLDMLRRFGVDLAQGYALEVPFAVERPPLHLVRREFGATVVRPDFVERRRVPR